jgi:nitrate/nitrite transporter NarK
VAQALSLIAADPALVLATRALHGVGLAAGFISGLEYLRAQGGSPFSQGLYGGIGLGGGGVALAAVPLLEDWLGWRAPFLSGIAVAVLAGIVLTFAPADVARSAGAAFPGAGKIRSVLRDRRIHRLSVMYMAALGLSVVLGNWVVSLLTRAGDYSDSVAGAIGSLILICGVVSRPLGGYLARRFPDRMRPIVLVSFVGAGIGTGLLAAAGPIWLSVIGTFLLGFSAGIPFTPAFIAATRIRPDAPALAMATVNMTANLVIVTGTPLLGLSFSLPGDGRIGFFAAIGLWLVAIGLTMSVRELDGNATPRGEQLMRASGRADQ